MALSYTQNLEDYHLSLAFAGQASGSYIDIGAGHPVADNVSFWFYLKGWQDKHPGIRYVADRRIVVDRGVATTTGISASMPMSLTLIEALAGRRLCLQPLPERRSANSS